MVGSIFFFSPLRMSEISLCRLPTASVVFVSGASQRSGLDDARFVGQILPELVRVEIFPDNRKRLDLAAAYCPEITFAPATKMTY